MTQVSVVGVKLTHDSAVALIRGNQLECVVELEKVGNNARYATMERLEQITELLALGGVATQDIDSWVLDGWFTQIQQLYDPAVEAHPAPSLVIEANGRQIQLPVAAYREFNDQPPLEGISLTEPLPGISDSYRSHHHSTGHLASGYCTSPFARQERVATVLVWDGGVAPRLYVVDPGRHIVRSLGSVLPLKGNAYIEVISRFPPFRLPENADINSFQRHQLSVPGKAMAYAGLGNVKHELLTEISEIYQHLAQQESLVSLPLVLADGIEEAAQKLDLESADVIHTWQAFLGNLLENALAVKLARFELISTPLILTGGCALNIAWNTQLRDSGRFDGVWVPPFPNDSGSALGAACAEMMNLSTRWSLDWDVYRGPDLLDEPIPPGWIRRSAGLAAVAELLHAGVPVMFMHGRAELGPRALGHRSILASATDRGTLDFLNSIKRREPYRPVAPLCMEERASEIFDPGGCDPFMLFQHRVRPAWEERIPAVSHFDGTARLQTVSREQEPVIHELLRYYERLSGIPVLCNTSANYPGRGFFPSIAAALRWGGVEHAWSEGMLYTRPDLSSAPS